ncbi:hypothetical protein FRB94_010477 [Tulasnella sp. JGI-2019a]|nr:hypothetical protein FRB93_009339 [Tulasnella sp. JGI-2019a]KAG8993670.1 hypothetical protein FRB94_010477 [Tulasnella sp. JGI-2019a]KAG9025352.1 hypothetical protein FRB95_010251 [Tulasnella sp. JGI-2019a]
MPNIRSSNVGVVTTQPARSSTMSLNGSEEGSHQSRAMRLRGGCDTDLCIMHCICCHTNDRGDWKFCKISYCSCFDNVMENLQQCFTGCIQCCENSFSNSFNDCCRIAPVNAPVTTNISGGNFTYQDQRQLTGQADLGKNPGIAGTNENSGQADVGENPGQADVKEKANL